MPDGEALREKPKAKSQMNLKLQLRNSGLELVWKLAFGIFPAPGRGVKPLPHSNRQLRGALTEAVLRPILARRVAVSHPYVSHALARVVLESRHCPPLAGDVGLDDGEPRLGSAERCHRGQRNSRVRLCPAGRRQRTAGARDLRF